MTVRERPWSGRRMHFVGVGGAGMSGYARAAHALGAQVSGSDRAASPYSERLAADGVLQAAIGEHDAANVPAGEDVEVVYSSAVPADNPERAAARALGLRERARAELLAELTALRRTIAVAGTHGKTTTSAMLVCALRAAGMMPDWLIGGTVGPGEANARWTGEGEWLVVEADESDRSMLMLDVEIVVLTNVELDHHATFASLADLREVFREFLAHARSAIVLWDRPDLLELAPAAAAATASVAASFADAAAATGVAAALAAAASTSGAASAAATAATGGPGEVELVTYDAPDAELAEGGSRFEWRGHEVRLAVPGAHNALNAIAALEAARLAGAGEQRAVAGLAGFYGAGRRMQMLGTAERGVEVYDDYAHHPTEVRATLEAARTLRHGRLVAVFQPHLYSRTAMLGRELGQALALADVVVVLDVYPARERAEDHPGVTGLPVAQAAADAAAGRPVYWLPAQAEAEPVLRGLLSDGDICVVMGAGDVDRLAHRLVESLVGGKTEGRRGAGRKARMPDASPQSGPDAGAPLRPEFPVPYGPDAGVPPIVQREVPLARMATVRTGGPAEWFARAGSEDELRELLAWARAVDAPVAVIGSGSNLLVADEGVRGLVVKLDRDLARIEVDSPRIVCGGGARLPAVAARAAQAGLSGIEFGVNIPGTVGGAVRMNANAYGGELARVLEWVEVVTAGGAERRGPDELGFGYRRSNLAAGEIVARASLRLVAAEVAQVKATLAGMRARRHEAQPQGIKTFGSTFKNPEGWPRADGAEGPSRAHDAGGRAQAQDTGRTAGQLLSAAGCNGLAIGGARFAVKHANFIENTGDATTADVVAVMSEGRRRVLERFGIELEPEVQTLGPVRFPWAANERGPQR